MKEAYRIAILVLFITETMTFVRQILCLLIRSIVVLCSNFRTTQYAIEAYRNKSTIYDAIPGGALVGFAMKMLHSPLAAAVATVQGAVMG